MHHFRKITVFFLLSLLTIIVNNKAITFYSNFAIVINCNDIENYNETEDSETEEESKVEEKIIKLFFKSENCPYNTVSINKSNKKFANGILVNNHSNDYSLGVYSPPKFL